MFNHKITLLTPKRHCFAPIYHVPGSNNYNSQASRVAFAPPRAPLVGKCDLWKLKNNRSCHIKTHYFTCPNTLSVISIKTDCARTQLVKNTVCTHTVVDIYQHMNIFLNFSPFSLCSIAENIVTLHRQKKKTRQRPSQDNENTTGKLSRQTQGGASRKQEQQVRLVSIDIRLVSIDIRLVSNKAILVSKIIVRF